MRRKEEILGEIRHVVAEQMLIMPIPEGLAWSFFGMTYGPFESEYADLDEESAGIEHRVGVVANTVERMTRSVDQFVESKGALREYPVTADILETLAFTQMITILMEEWNVDPQVFQELLNDQIDDPVIVCMDPEGEEADLPDEYKEIKRAENYRFN